MARESKSLSGHITSNWRRAPFGALNHNSSPKSGKKGAYMNITDDMVEIVREELQVPDIVPDDKVRELIERLMGARSRLILP